MNELMEAVENNDIDAINRLCSETPEAVNFVNKQGYTPLILAAELGHEEAVAALINQGADVNFCTEKKGTALVCAYTEEQTEIVMILLREGADVNLCSPKQAKPIILAAERSDFAAMRLFIVHGANLDEVNYDGSSLLHYAAKEGDLETVEFLLRQGVNIDRQDKEGYTPLMLADCYDHNAVIDYLLKNDANPIVVDDYEKTVIDYAIENEKFERAEKYKHYMNRIDALGNTWLHKTVLGPGQTLTQLYRSRLNNSFIKKIYQKRKQSVVALLKHKIDPNALNNQNQTALHIAAKDESNTSDTIIFHLLFGPDDVHPVIDVQKAYFESNCHIAHFYIRQQFRNRVLTLTTISNFTLSDREGKTAWQNAIESTNANYVAMFLAAGVDITKNDFELARGLPYTESLLRLHEIADDYADLETARPAFLREIKNILLDKNTDLADGNSYNYAFISCSIEACLFTPAALAETIRNENIDIEKLVKRAKKADEEIFRFFQEVQEELSPPSIPFAFPPSILFAFNEEKQDRSRESASSTTRPYL